MLYKHGKRTPICLEAFSFMFYVSFLYFGGVFDKTILPLARVAYEMIIANFSATSRVGYLSPQAPVRTTRDKFVNAVFSL